MQNLLDGDLEEAMLSAAQVIPVVGSLASDTTRLFMSLSKATDTWIADKLDENAAEYEIFADIIRNEMSTRTSELTTMVVDGYSDEEIDGAVASLAADSRNARSNLLKKERSLIPTGLQSIKVRRSVSWLIMMP